MISFHKIRFVIPRKERESRARGASSIALESKSDVSGPGLRGDEVSALFPSFGLLSNQ